MSKSLAAILGGAAGGVALVVIILIVIWYCVFRGRNASRTSDTGSSDPSVQGNNYLHMCVLVITTFITNM